MRGWKGAFVALFVCSWAGNQFTPLLLMYKEIDGYSTVTVNAFLGVYVLGLAPSLVFAGPLSERFGRRPVMFVGTLTSLATSLVLSLGFLGPVAISVGRLFAGVTVGTAMAVGTSWLNELSKAPYDAAADKGAGARRASLAFCLGSAIGALVAGVLAEWGPLPEVLPYLVHLVVTVPAVILVARLPETHAGQAAVSVRHNIRRLPVSHRRFRWVVVVAAPWIFALAALSYGYVPVLLRDQVQGYGVAYATLLTVVALVISALVQPVAKHLAVPHSARGLICAMVAMTVSVAGIGLVAVTGSLALGVVTAATSGVGIGIALSTGLLEIQRIAEPAHLAGLTGLFYALAYLGFLLPTAMAAVTPVFSNVELFGGLTVLALLCTATLMVNSHKHLPAPAGI